MRSGVPWSVKGIEPEAREAAKQAARRAGVTLGAWLNQVIMDTGTDEVGPQEESPMTSQSPYGRPQAAPGIAIPEPKVDLGPVAEAVRELVQRVDGSERRTAEMTRKLEATVSQLAARLDEPEHDMDDRYQEARSLDPLERKLQQLGERMERAERGRGGLRPEDARAIQTLEKAMNAVVDHLDATERRTDETLIEIRQSLASLSHRIENAEQESEREEAKKRARALEDTLMQLATRMEKMETGVSGIGSQAVNAALKAIEEKSNAENQRATIDRLQKSIEQISARIEQTEQRSDQTAKTLETTVSSIVRKIEEIDLNSRTHIPDALAQRLEQMAERLQHNEQLTVEAAQTVERAIAGIGENLTATESRDREALSSLQTMIERMTNRLGQLEKETKAAKAQAALSPQLNAGSLAAGFPPAGPGYGMNFDAPQMMNPSMGGNLGPSFGPSDWGRQDATRQDWGRQHEAERSAPAVTAPPLHEAPPYAARDARSFEEDSVPPPFVAETHDETYEDFGDHQEMRGQYDDGIIPPDPVEPMQNAGQRAASDFLAAARRAAQAAAEGGTGRQEPYYGSPPSPGFAESSSRFSAQDQGETRRRKLFLAVAGSFVLLALLAGAYVMLKNGSTPTQAPVVLNNPGNARPTVLDTTPLTAAPDGPAANPAETGAGETAAPVTDAAPNETPAVPNEALVPAPKAPAAAQPSTGTPAGQATLTPAPSLAPAPSTPVETAPVEPAKVTLLDAARGGNAAAQYEVGQRYANGEGVTQDMSEAARWFERAANQDLTIAQYRLATQYEKGRGVPQDDAKARDWYEKAAAGGNVKAMHNLAVIHAEGRGTAQDFETASRWFTQAADFGLGDSQYNLAILNERGLGIEKNLVEAYKWLDIAAKGGDKGAAAKRDAIATELSADDLARAKIASGTWRAKKPEPVANGDMGTLKRWDISSMEGATSASAPVTRADVARVQELLNRLGYNAGSPDGLMGPRTRDAILEYQLTEGLETTGTATRETLTSLEARLS
ncbi:Peptidoglycan-binding domain 1 protein [Parvibaculum lavamentivorans DS-1]|uniref:Peptidoglycan-binding domain 1 protein n=1 Tax=Parvibaculum lavamentivorans (strain DS-1 / DSM 13023 / NCIMB 13966) TaxID=402881 RepID=A7HQ98_PARL1|nr:peptidoglycan-binding protein [Parvibaculum lavamentivorans]ABS62081.1 Peptidoglycan-binding domain 1 protein [Parvibaculum lavamentivorans DS-1]